MSPIRLIIAILVLAGLGGAIYWSNLNEAAKEGQPDPDAPPRILALNEEQLTRIEVQRREEAPTVLTREDNGDWLITHPERLNTRPGEISTLTSAASALDSTRVVDENPTDLASYNLDPADVTVTFSLSDGTDHVLTIGGDTTDGTGTYVMVSGDSRLYTMEAARKATFDKGVMDLRERHLLTFNPDRVSVMDLNVAGKPPIQFVQQDSKWSITRPQSWRADGLAVQNLLGTVADTEMDPLESPEISARAFAAGRPFATVTLTNPDGKLTLNIRESTGQYYAQSSQTEGAYLVALETGIELDRKLDDFRNKKLFDFGFDTPSRVEYTNGGETRVFEKADSDWLENNRILDSLGIQNMIGKLRDLEASTFDDANVTEPDIEITVVLPSSGEGAEPTTEHVSLIKSSGGYLAVRPESSDVYFVDEADIVSLRQAVAAVREAPEPPQ